VRKRFTRGLIYESNLQLVKGAQGTVYLSVPNYKEVFMRAIRILCTVPSILHLTFQ